MDKRNELQLTELCVAVLKCRARAGSTVAEMKRQMLATAIRWGIDVECKHNCTAYFVRFADLNQSVRELAFKTAEESNVAEILSSDTLRLGESVLRMYPDAPIPPLLEAMRKEKRDQAKLQEQEDFQLCFLHGRRSLEQPRPNSVCPCCAKESQDDPN